MAETINYIKKVQLSNGSVYYIKDEEAHEELLHRVKDTGGTITGDLYIDGLLQTKNLKVVSIDDCPVAVDNVLTQVSDGSIQKRDADNLLEDIGGMTCKMSDTEDGLLIIKVGR